MCFSAEASFTAASILAVMGVATLKKITSSSQFFIAAIPLLFAFQQFSEGLVWLHLTHHMGSDQLFVYAQKSFLIFAFLIWPIWIPLSLLLLEKTPWRQRILFTLLGLGILLTLLNIFFYTARPHINVQVINQSLQYFGEAPPQAIIYPIVVLLPCFISSIKQAQLFGLLALIGYFVSDYFYRQTFTSVWCFYAAIMSIVMYRIVSDYQISSNPTES